MVSMVVMCSLLAAAIMALPYASGTSPTHTITLPTGANAGAAVYDTANGELYVADTGNCALDAISSTYSVSSITLTGCLGLVTNVVGLAYDSHNDFLYVLDRLGNQVFVINGSSNTLAATVSLPLHTYPVAEVYDTSNYDVYISNFCLGTCTSDVTVMSGITNSATIALTSAGAGAIGFNPDNGDIYVYTAGVSTGCSCISVIATSTGTVSATTLSVTAASVSGMVYDPANENLYVAEGS
ncbi:MAG: hypothetical protein L3K03_06055 [Thermoplasmata archaeon]|nr:hypothetical protein [Thermoplasmata archaeon]